MKIVLEDGAVSYDEKTDRWKLSSGEISVETVNGMNAVWQSIPDWPREAQNMLVYRAYLLSTYYKGDLSGTEKYLKRIPGAIY